GADVPVSDELGWAIVGGDIVVDERGTGLDRFERVEDGGEIGVLDLDQPGGRLRNRLCLGGDRGNRVADEAGAGGGKWGHVLDDRPEPAAAGACGEDRLDAGQPLRGRGVDPNDASVGTVAANDFAVEHPGQGQIGGVPGTAGDLIFGVEPA